MTKEALAKLILTNYPIHHLNEKERLDPLLVIKDVFSHAHLPEIRDMLWRFFKSNITGSFPDTNEVTLKERVEMVILYELLLRIVEAIYLLHETDRERAITTSANL